MPVVAPSAPAMFWMVPPEALPPSAVLVPSPLMVRLPRVPVVSSTMPLAPPFEETLWKVRPAAAMVELDTERPVPVPVLMVLLPLCTEMPVAPPEAKKPWPEVVSMSRLPPVKLMVEPAFELIVTALLAPGIERLGGAAEVVGAAAVARQVDAGIARAREIAGEAHGAAGAAGDVGDPAGAVVGDRSGIGHVGGAEVDVESVARSAGDAERAAVAGERSAHGVEDQAAAHRRSRRSPSRRSRRSRARCSPC